MSRAGTHPEHFSPYGVSQSYYIHGRGAKGEVTLRVSDHDNPFGMGATARVTVDDTEAEVDEAIAKFLEAAKASTAPGPGRRSSSRTGSVRLTTPLLG